MKTIEQEKLEGCPGRRPLNEKAPKPKKSVPNPPKFLGRIGKRAYHELSRLIGPDNMNVMASTDGLALAMICDAFQEYRDASKTLEEEGRYYTTPGGSRKRHPAVGDRQDAWKRVMSGLSRFGLTPYDRKNVNILAEEKKMSKSEKQAKRRSDAKKRAEKLKEQAANGPHIRAAK